MIAKIEQLLKEVEALHASNAEELEALRIKYLSKKGAINDLMADFRNVAAEQKKEVGMKLNELKTKAQEEQQRKEEERKAAIDKLEREKEISGAGRNNNPVFRKISGNPR